MTGSTRKEPYCSFCGKSKDEVACLVAGPHVFICEECIGACVAYLPPRSRLSALATMLSPWKWRYRSVPPKAAAGTPG
jgi:hypothetical protein